MSLNADSPSQFPSTLLMKCLLPGPLGDDDQGGSRDTGASEVETLSAFHLALASARRPVVYS